MKKYACSILYKCNEEKKIFELLSMAIKVLGFEPRYMNILFDEFSESLKDIEFDENYLFTLLRKTPSSIIIKNKLYEEDNPQNFCNFSFRITKDEHFSLQSCSLSWLNKNLNFLIDSDYFKSFLGFENLVYNYCYNQYDCYEQSNTSRRNPDFDKPIKPGESTREFILHDIDISEHWGRVLSIRGMSFMAAPLMWFGEGFYRIISKEKLLKFKYASLASPPSFNLVHVKLFELYDDPSKGENRNKQKEFWNFFDLQNRIKQYENENPIDAVAWLKARAAAKKKQKSRK
jgi:hypothetical protein